MTFIVNQDGTIYEKNLGKNTGERVQAIKGFNPDDSWKAIAHDEPEW